MQGRVRNPGDEVRRGGNRRALGRVAASWLAALLFIGWAGRVLGQTSASSEYQVKAAFLFHFAQFVEWPPETFKDATSPVTYCTASADPFHGVLEAGLDRKTIGGRPIRVLHFKQAQEIQGCQVLFVGTQEKKFISTILANVRATPVLTVGESENFARQGGMIGFFLEDNKVRFEINLDAAEQAKLKISARLLTLAKTVIGGPKGI